MDYSYIDVNYNDVIRKLSDSCEVLPDITVAIKSAEIDEIEYLVKNHPIKAIGENRVQQFLERYERLKELNIPIHFNHHLILCLKNYFMLHF